jgi:uncharacterized coiled-coil protein SlyX
MCVQCVSAEQPLVGELDATFSTTNVATRTIIHSWSRIARPNIKQRMPRTKRSVNDHDVDNDSHRSKKTALERVTDVEHAVSDVRGEIAAVRDAVAETNANISSLNDQMGAMMRLLQQQQESPSAAAVAPAARSSLAPPTPAAAGGSTSSAVSPTRSVSPLPSPSSSVQLDSAEFVDRHKVVRI